MSPSDLATKGAPETRRLRLGGLVEAGSVTRQADGRTIDFRVTDGSSAVPKNQKAYQYCSDQAPNTTMSAGWSGGRLWTDGPPGSNEYCPVRNRVRAIWT